MAKKRQSKNKQTKPEAQVDENVESLVINAGSAMAMFEMQDDSVGFVDAINADAEAAEIEAAIVDATTDGNEDAEVAALDEDITGVDSEEMDLTPADTEGTELEAFTSAEIEDIEEIPEEKLVSIVESLLFASDKPQSVAVLKAAFAGTKIRSADIRKALKHLEVEYMSGNRGVDLVEVASGYQIRTKAENATYLQRTIKARPFRLSGPALEVLSIVAYKQPCAKFMVDEIRGVESGHLMRGLLDRGLITFGEKSELPGRPMFYETTRKFLEIFGLRQVQELPTLNEIDQLIPEGIGQPEEKKQTLSDLTGELSQTVGTSYSEGEADLTSISEELQGINLSTAFFEEEKIRQRDKKDLEKAQEIRERMVIGEAVATREKNWLERYDNGTLHVAKANPFAKKPVVAEAAAADGEAVPMIESLEEPMALEADQAAVEVSSTDDMIDEMMEAEEQVEPSALEQELFSDAPSNESEPEETPQV
jgi:segregation and condensation protein B